MALNEVPDLNFGDMLDELAKTVPERTAIVFGNVVWSWKEFDERSNRLARKLIEIGLKPDSKVAFFLRNSPAYVELFAACVKARMVHANVNYRYVDHELFYLLDNSDSELVVYDEEFRPQVESLRARLPKVRAYLEVGTGTPPAFAMSFESACTTGDDRPLDIERKGTDLYFMYTGGTTGYPKGVMWQLKDRIAVIGMADADSADAHAKMISESPDVPVAITAAPMMHSTGLTTLMSTLARGGKLVILPSPSFDAGVCLREIERHQVKRLAIVGDAFSVPLLRHLRDHADEYDLSSLLVITSAGAMWSEQFKQELLEYFPSATLADSLGSSEGSRIGAITTKRGEASKTGRFELGPHVKVFTEDFREVEPGSGESGMLAKGGPLPLGYYKDPERTEQTFPTVNGVRYSLAGDWCRVEADGTMPLLGRGNNCINTGGEKVYPEEVEEILKLLPDILDAAVLGVADERWGQAVGALVNTGEGALDEARVQEHLDTHLARYKHPKHLICTEAAFRHENGKINYRGAKRLLDDALAEQAQAY